MADYGEMVAPGTVRFERRLPGSVEEIWSWLVDSDKRGQWFARGPMDLKPGGKIEFFHKHSELSPHQAPPPEKYKEMDATGHRSTGRVIRVEPPRLLSFDWDEEDGSASQVTIELAPVDGEVRLVLTHSRLCDRKMMVDVSGGWHSHLAVLEYRAAGKVPLAFWTLHEGVEEIYEERIPVDAPAG